ncbi:PEPxxWA-CTERM sorting domain-containing protein [Sphingomonas sp. BIUV-7]|uniref:PEPxxWA-CTERM sorting domain-containing protein n=1 Tax=Sphingomonas natans TaxID=3063330 RepID=A0ABT8YDH4_9SPHN|nr:PEPxxWA-CTERM sorting domain-containing protein [Sphingomonas sp. BIUV-7]MDO6416374.1 PEPxxWA-CTERM sorting domain-containing protein [Sphingomonas sp. BIUV-7]
MNSGIFWASNAALGPNNAGANGQKTLQAWITDNAGSQLTVVGVSIGVGSGWAGDFKGAVDNVDVRFDRAAAIVSNFEVAAVPEPATWGIFIGGFGLVGGALRRSRRTSVRFA